MKAMSLVLRPAAAALLLLAVCSAAPAQTLTLVTKSAFAQQGASGLGPLPPGARVLSDHGRYLVFESDAPNLVSGQVDANGETDVFLHDRVHDTFALVSHVPASAVTAGHSVSDAPALSAAGNHIVFASTATDLVAGDSAGPVDVFHSALPPVPVELQRFTLE